MSPQIAHFLFLQFMNLSIYFSIFLFLMFYLLNFKKISPTSQGGADFVDRFLWCFLPNFV